MLLLNRLAPSNVLSIVVTPEMSHSAPSNRSKAGCLHEEGKAAGLLAFWPEMVQHSLLMSRLNTLAC